MSRQPPRAIPSACPRASHAKGYGTAEPGPGMALSCITMPSAGVAADGNVRAHRELPALVAAVRQSPVSSRMIQPLDSCSSAFVTMSVRWHPQQAPGASTNSFLPRRRGRGITPVSRSRMTSVGPDSSSSQATVATCGSGTWTSPLDPSGCGTGAAAGGENRHLSALPTIWVVRTARWPTPRSVPSIHLRGWDAQRSRTAQP
jgi:hypothetical protein